VLPYQPSAWSGQLSVVNLVKAANNKLTCLLILLMLSFLCFYASAGSMGLLITKRLKILFGARHAQGLFFISTFSSLPLWII
jgi:hypothetical protein